MENIALQSLQTLYFIVLRTEIATTFGSKNGNNFLQNVENLQLRASQCYIFHTLQNFSTKFWNFTTFKRFFPRNFVFCLDLSRSKISLECKSSIGSIVNVSCRIVGYCRSISVYNTLTKCTSMPESGQPKDCSVSFALNVSSICSFN